MENVVSTGLIGLSLGSQYAMIAIGFTLIFGIMGVINFMHGGGYVLGGYFAFVLATKLSLPFPVAVAGAALGAAAVGYLVEILSSTNMSTITTRRCSSRLASTSL